MKKLKEFIENSTSPFHLIQAAKQKLEGAGYRELKFNEEWEIKNGDKIYVSPYTSMIFAFHIGEGDDEDCNLRIAAAHTDFPCFKIKPACEITDNGYYKLNVEVYGGPILNTWMDRPLSISGKVSLKSGNCFEPEIRLIDFGRPVLTIPNLAIHMNKEVNKGIELNKQKDMLPIADIIENEVNQVFLLEHLASELNVDTGELLDFELMVYQTEKGEAIGFGKTMYSSPRLDNITSVYACLEGLISGMRTKGINAIALFDNEEIGSRTNKGAASSLFPIILERLFYSLGKSKVQYYNDLAGGFIVSADVAHCLHPNAPEKNDLTNKVMLNGGIVIKYAASQSYANDCESSGVLIQLCEEHKIPYQKFVNRSDTTSGSTLGSILSTVLPIRTIDVGIPLLAMHSARELMGIKDQNNLNKLIHVFFS